MIAPGRPVNQASDIRQERARPEDSGASSAPPYPRDSKARGHFGLLAPGFVGAPGALRPWVAEALPPKPARISGLGARHHFGSQARVLERRPPPSQTRARSLRVFGSSPGCPGPFLPLASAEANECSHGEGRRGAYWAPG